MMRFLVLSIILIVSCQSSGQQKEKKNFPVEKSNQEWKKELSDQEYYILREAGTEKAYSSDLLKIKENGTFVCAACENPLYKTKNKFKSGTGWPSFDKAIKGGIAYSSDKKLGYTRKELLCGECGSHLGHVFDDGPQETTGKRHCINGVALNFKPKNE